MARRKMSLRKMDRRLAARKKQHQIANQSLHARNVHIPYGSRKEPGAAKRG